MRKENASQRDTNTDTNVGEESDQIELGFESEIACGGRACRAQNKSAAEGVRKMANLRKRMATKELQLKELRQEFEKLRKLVLRASYFGNRPAADLR